jgi:hypothetical protein
MRSASSSSGIASISAAASARWCSAGAIAPATEPPSARTAAAAAVSGRSPSGLAISSARAAQSRAPGVPHPVEADHRQIDHQLGGQRRGGVLEPVEGVRQAGVRLLEAAEEQLDASARAG